MQLNGNAALGPNKPRLFVHRVVDEEWSLTKAAAGCARHFLVMK